MIGLGYERIDSIHLLILSLFAVFLWWWWYVLAHTSSSFVNEAFIARIVSRTRANTPSRSGKIIRKAPVIVDRCFYWSAPVSSLCRLARNALNCNEYRFCDIVVIIR